jgi:hypothetical protein
VWYDSRGMAKRKNTLSTDEQRKLFQEAAKEVGADKTGRTFERAIAHLLDRKRRKKPA